MKGSLTSSTGTGQCQHVPSSTANNNNRDNSSSSLGMGRVLYVICLLIVAALLGFFAYYFVDRSQSHLAETQFESIAERALKAAESIAARKQSGTKIMASVVAQAIPDAQLYPFVTVPGFEAMATNVLETSAARELGFVPLVRQDQLTQFEAFAYQYFAKRFPNHNATGVSKFGRGVWASGPDGERHHDTTGTPNPGISNRTVLTPILQHDSGPHPVLMYNIRSEESRARQIEDLLECTDYRLLTGNQSIRCGAITDIVTLRGQPPGTGPGAVILEPIYPANQPTLVTAILASPIVWDEILEDVFADTVSGIDCVLETTRGTVYTYRIERGIARRIMEEEWTDSHDTKYDRFRRSVQFDAHQYTSNSPKYTLHLYPNDAFYQVYYPFHPLAATLLVVGAMVFTALTFVTYDGCVRKEFASKRALLDARRQFVRYISHEVRTPLNSVCMGLTLMQEQLAQRAGFECAELLTRYLEMPEQHASLSSKRVDTTTKETVDSVVLDEFSLVSDLLQGAQSSVEVLNDFLNYDKIETGKLKLDLQVVPIRALVESTAKEFRRSATQKHLEYQVIFDADRDSSHNGASRDVEEGFTDASHKMALIGDQVRIQQVLRNLISNAIKFTSNGKVEIRVRYIPPDKNQPRQQAEFQMKDSETRVFTFDGQVQVDVQDTGAGLTRQQLAKLFSEHMQFNANALQAGRGSGLGLFIAKGIVEQHAGTLVASSEGLGCGATLSLTLPLYEADVGDHAERTELSDISARSAEQTPIDDVNGISAKENTRSARHHRILIVDDALSNRKMMNRLLTHHGHFCELAEDGEVAVRMVLEAVARQQAYDTVLMDFEMPALSGPDATKMIRQYGLDTLIVGVTGSMFPEDTERFLTSGANSVLPKPFKMKALDTVWVEHFDNRCE